jgi:hypothetical protein
MYILVAIVILLQCDLYVFVALLFVVWHVFNFYEYLISAWKECAIIFKYMILQYIDV